MNNNDEIGLLLTLALLSLLPAIFALISRYTSKNIKGTSVDDETKNRFKDIFSEPTEEYISSLGNGYIISYLSSRSVSKGFAIISNKRVYFKGKCFYRENGKLKKSFEERTVDLKDVTGTGYTRVNPVSLLISAIAAILIYALCITVGYDLLAKSDLGAPVTVVLLITFSTLLTSYILKRNNLFQISFAGGLIAFNINLYDKSEIDDFQKQLRRAKDNVVDTINVQPKQAVVQHNTNNTRIGLADELKKYADLLQQGLITQDEYNEVKKGLLANTSL